MHSKMTKILKEFSVIKQGNGYYIYEYQNNYYHG